MPQKKTKSSKATKPRTSVAFLKSEFERQSLVINTLRKELDAHRNQSKIAIPPANEIWNVLTRLTPIEQNQALTEVVIQIADSRISSQSSAKYALEKASAEFDDFGSKFPAVIAYKPSIG